MSKRKVGNKVSEHSEVNTEVKQWDGLSAVLFALRLHYVVKCLDQRSTIFYRTSQICAYADGIVVARSRKWNREVYEELERKAVEIGLIVKKKNITVMSSSKGEGQQKRS